MHINPWFWRFSLFCYKLVQHIFFFMNYCTAYCTVQGEYLWVLIYEINILRDQTTAILFNNTDSHKNWNKKNYQKQPKWHKTHFFFIHPVWYNIIQVSMWYSMASTSYIRWAFHWSPHSESSLHSLIRWNIHVYIHFLFQS